MLKQLYVLANDSQWWYVFYMELKLITENNPNISCSYFFLARWAWGQKEAKQIWNALKGRQGEALLD